MPERIEVHAVRNGGLDHIEVPTRDEALIAALLRERAGYAQYGHVDRVAEVDVELARHGYQDETPTPPARKRNRA